MGDKNMTELDIVKRPIEFFRNICLMEVEEFLASRNRKMTGEIKGKISKVIYDREDEIKNLVKDHPLISKDDVNRLCIEISNSCLESIH